MGIASIALPARPRIITLRSVKYDGSLNYWWPARVLAQDETGFIWHTPLGAPFTRPSGISLVPYDWVGQVWYERWYAVDASLLPVGSGFAPGLIHHYYCNIGAPGAWDGATFRYVDLDLDVWIGADGHARLLDEDELAAHTARFGYPAALVAAVYAAAEEARALVRAGAPPFDGLLAAYHQALNAPRA